MIHSRLTQTGLQISTANGWIVYQPRQTRIVEAHDTDVFCIVREYYMGFSGSNVYAIDENLKIAWVAELPHESDIYANILTPSADGFVTSTWNGIKCLIDAKSGRITKLGVSK